MRSNALTVFQENSLGACKLLIVEDDRTNVALLREHLQRGGYHNLYFAQDGEEGVRMTHEIKPDLVLLDMLMPGMDGFDYCQYVQSSPELAHIPIIVQTTLEHQDDKLRAFAMGSSDYVTKPTHAPELLARIKVHLTNKLMREDISKRQLQLQNEMRAAEDMQRNLMPTGSQMDMLERIYNLNIAQYFEPSSIMGGDFWGTHPISDTRLAIYMLDFSGHGVSAAMNVFRMHTLMQELAASGNNAGHFLTTLNHHLHPLIARNEFATMFYGIIDEEANSLEYACAAVPPTLIERPHAAHSEWLHSRGFPLGAIANASYETHYTPFAPGDALVMFSDCFTEAKNTKGEAISEKAISKCVHNAMAERSIHKASHVMQRLLEHFRSHAPGALPDDLTMNVYIRR